LVIDTRPSIGIAELMRPLIDACDGVEHARRVKLSTLVNNNHTLLREALGRYCEDI
jgi:glucan phosphorylase